MPEKKSSSCENHWMNAMLAPGSIAIVGASEKPEGFCERVHHLLKDTGYPGRLYMVNPRYDRVFGIQCHTSLISLPAVPDLVVMVIGSRAMEPMVKQAIDIGCKGIVIFANNYLQDDTQPKLLDLSLIHI